MLAGERKRQDGLEAGSDKQRKHRHIDRGQRTGPYEWRSLREDDGSRHGGQQNARGRARRRDGRRRARTAGECGACRTAPPEFAFFRPICQQVCRALNQIDERTIERGASRASRSDRARGPRRASRGSAQFRSPLA